MTDAERLASALKRLGWSGRRFAVRFHVSQTQLRRYLSGTASVPSVILERVEDLARYVEERLES